MSARTPATGTTAHWEWVPDEGGSVPYAYVDSAMLEREFQANKLRFKTTALSFNSEYQTVYIFDFDEMIQINTESGTRRKVRRIVETSTAAGDDDLAMMRAMSSAVLPPAAPTLPTPPLPTPPKPTAGAAGAPPALTKYAGSKHGRDDDDATPDDGIDDDDVPPPPPVARVSAPAVPPTLPPPKPTAAAVTKGWALAGEDAAAPTTAPPPPLATPVAAAAGWAASAASAAPAPVPITATPVDAATDEDDTASPTPAAAAAAPTPPAPVVPVVSAEAIAAAAAAAAAASEHVPTVPAGVVAEQEALGPQSLRKHAKDFGAAATDAHASSCFDKMLQREKQLVGEWAVFYHSYSYAALLYEVHAAVAAVLFRFKAEYSTLPRLLKKPFLDYPDAKALQKAFKSFGGKRDHDPRFRAVGLSGTTSLVARDAECTPAQFFMMGYSCTDLSFRGVLEELLVSCGVPEKLKKALADDIIKLSCKHGLDVSQFGGSRAASGKAGHLQQIFVRRTLVNRFIYAALPYGVTDGKRPDLEKALEGKGVIVGQVRIVANPSAFMRAGAVRMYTYSADAKFHGSRAAFQREMAALLSPIIGTSAKRVEAAKGIYGGQLPGWFTADDYEKQQQYKDEMKKAAAVKAAAAAAAAVIVPAAVAPA